MVILVVELVFLVVVKVVGVEVLVVVETEVHEVTAAEYTYAESLTSQKQLSQDTRITYPTYPTRHQQSSSFVG